MKKYLYVLLLVENRAEKSLDTGDHPNIRIDIGRTLFNI